MADNDDLPISMAEFEARTVRNTVMTGTGLADTEVHVPCPFCGAADFMVYRILDVREVAAKGAVCCECRRGAKSIFRQGSSSTSFEVVQTCGPDQPEWLEPKMRRLA